MARKPTPKTWRDDIAAAFRLLTLAETYADDGAFLTAADRAEEAAKQFRAGVEARTAMINAATVSS